MESDPKQYGDNGAVMVRDSTGRFVRGNPGGPGNPMNRRVNELRVALLECVTPDDMQAVIHALVDAAKAGDVAAIREFLDRTIGKARDNVALEVVPGASFLENLSEEQVDRMVYRAMLGSIGSATPQRLSEIKAAVAERERQGAIPGLIAGPDCQASDDG
ncbi:MAG TPA: hypothetical protein PL033_19610 [Candidatus Brocadiia bacterium]|nr:hypothetical protein [Candidatus Brocadiia bacterium]